METKQLLQRISALGKRNAAIKGEIQALGVACLEHIEAHGDVMPLNRLVMALQRSQVRAFVEWALAFGKVKRNTDKATKETMPLAFDKTRTTDIQGANDKPWDEFAPTKAESVAKAFDLQAAVMRVLKQAADAGKDQSIINALGAAAGIDPALVPKVPAPVTAEAATL